MPTLPNLVHAHAHTTPDHVALVHADTALTYAELSRRGLALAWHLRERGIGREQIVAVEMPRSIEAFVAFVGILTAGAAYLPLDPKAPTARRERQIAESGAALVLQEGSLAGCEQVGELSSSMFEDPAPEQLAYVIYTSGSSGHPKGVLLEHAGLLNLARVQRDSFELGPDSRVLQFAALTFDAATWEWVMALCWGATLCIVPEGSARTAELGAWLARYGVTHATLPPAVLPGLDPRALPSLEHLIVAGEVCPASVAARWAAGRHVWNAYGPTEATVCATMGAFDPRVDGFPIGRALANVSVEIVDAEQRPVAAGEVGEIRIGGIGVARGYLGDVELGRFSSEPSRSYRTGDRGLVRPDGQIEFLGRLDRQLKLRGVRIEPEEIEARLASHPSVRQCAIVLRERDDGEAQLIALLVATTAIDAVELRLHLVATLPSAMLPTRFEQVDALPLTTHGKIDHRACASLTGRVLAEHEGQAGIDTHSERVVAELFTELLGIGGLDRESDFFALGGSSLLAARLVERLSERFGVVLPASQPFTASSVKMLAAAIEQRLVDAASRAGSPITKAAPDQRVTLSFAQQRLWFLAQTGRHPVDYNLPIQLRVRGPFDRDALARALVALTHRHAVLRTCYVTTNAGEPRAVELPAECAVLVHERHTSDASPDEAVDVWLAAQERHEFALEHAPPLRTCVLELGEHDHVVSLLVHHIAFDGASSRVLARDLSTLYREALDGRETSSLPALDVSYADFAAWQRKALDEPQRSRLLDYWTTTLRGLVPLRLPATTSTPGPVRGAMHAFSLSRARTRVLRAFAAEQRTTLHAAALAVFSVLLRYVGGQDSVVVGSPVAGRERGTLDELIGLFVNPLVLRIELGDRPSFTTLLARVREVIAGAIEHQALPFERLVRELSPDRAIDQHPLFSIMFVVQDAEAMQPRFELPGAQVELLGVPGLARQAARLDQEWHLWLEGEQLRGVCSYDASRFDAHTIAGMVERFELQLDELLAAPDDSIATRPSEVAPTEDEPVRGIHELVLRQAARTPTLPALRHGDAWLDYATLCERSSQLAAWLQGQGVGPEQIVAICLPRCFDAFVAILAILRAGGAYLPLDPDSPPARLAFMLRDASPTLMLTHTRVAERMRASSSFDAGMARLVELDTSTFAPEFASVGALRVPAIEAHNLAYVIYTSGSTGVPKGVLLEHAGLINLARAQRALFGVGPGTRVLQFASLAFDAATWEWVMALSSGACLCLLDDDVPRSPTLGEHLRRLGITCATLPPALLPSLDPRSLPDLDQLILAGEACPLPLAEQWARGRRLWNAYGPTETSVCATVHAWDPAHPGMPIGRPLPGLRVDVLDEHLQPVAEGEVGELCIGGIALARGYLNRPELDTFVRDPSDPRGRLYRSGDLGRRRSDGLLEFIGRRDRQVKVRGHRVELGEIEALLQTLPEVTGAAALGHASERGGLRLLAYVCLAPVEHDERGQIERWRELYDGHALHEPSEPLDPHFDTSGWTSKITGRPIPLASMRSWAGEIVDIVLAGRPRRVWELGCGRGLLLFAIAPHCERYLGSDLSQTSIDRVRQHCEAAPDRFAHVELAVREALDTDELDAGPFDAIVINSVVQYLPSLDYLERVLARCLERLAPGGRIFVGDVRNLRLLDAFVALAHVDAARESELLVDPAYFAALAQRLPGIREVEIQLQHDHGCELSDFRYHVVIHGGAPPQESAERGEWLAAAGMSASEVRARLLVDQTDAIGFAGLHNRRVALESGDALVEPDDLRRIGAELGYRVEVCWSSEDAGAIDVAFTRLGSRLRPPLLDAPTPTRALANVPRHVNATASCLARVRAHLHEHLPSAMVPELIEIDRMPLTSNGKLDYAALARPARAASHVRDNDAPRSMTEQTLCRLFAELLEREAVGRNDDFFALGGHSLLAIALIAAIRQQFERELPLAQLFEHPTPARLAARLARGHQATERDEPEPLLLHAMQRAALLEPELRPVPAWRRPLLTGATGYVGGYLLRDLLARPDVEQVTCLVRAHTQEHGLRRIIANLESLGQWRPEHAERIVAIPSDLSKPQLGLCAADLDALAHDRDVVFHAGAEVNFFRHYGLLEAANVEGTRALLQLACRGASKAMHYVSTLGVFEGRARTLTARGERAVVSESQWPDLREAGRATGYCQSKSVAELLLAAARSRGISVTVHRPAAIFGDSRTGVCSRREFVVDLIERGVRNGMLPDLRIANYMIPVDVVSRHIVEVAARGSAGGNHHVMAASNVAMSTIAAWVREVGREVELVEFDTFVARALDPVAPSELRELVPLLELEASLGRCMDAIEFERREFVTVLERWNGGDFVVDATYGRRCMAWLLGGP